MNNEGHPCVIPFAGQPVARPLTQRFPGPNKKYAREIANFSSFNQFYLERFCPMCYCHEKQDRFFSLAYGSDRVEKLGGEVGETQEQRGQNK
jgi:hypothetical protein